VVLLVVLEIGVDALGDELDWENVVLEVGRPQVPLRISAVHPGGNEKEAGRGRERLPDLIRQGQGERTASGIATDDDPTRANGEVLEEVLVGGHALKDGLGEGGGRGEGVLDTEDGQLDSPIRHDLHQVGEGADIGQRGPKNIATT